MFVITKYSTFFYNQFSPAIHHCIQVEWLDISLIFKCSRYCLSHQMVLYLPLKQNKQKIYEVIH
jgi:hypothetical protein